MRKLTLICAASLAASAAALTSASAFVPAPAGPAAAATEVDQTITVKSNKWTKRPPGWNRGRKAGWRGGSMPPGQAKKHRY